MLRVRGAVRPEPDRTGTEGGTRTESRAGAGPGSWIRSPGSRTGGRDSDEGGDQQGEGRDDDGDADGARDRVTALARAYLGFAARNPAVYDAMFELDGGLAFASEDTPEPLKDAFAALLESLGEVAGDGVHPGLFTEVFWAGLHGPATLNRAGRLPPGAPSGGWSYRWTGSPCSDAPDACMIRGPTLPAYSARPPAPRCPSASAGRVPRRVRFPGPVRAGNRR
ncbi:hypothetical protein SUDANB121_03714 [Nocardiopsis dassonvillei]|uniref:TetR-like C-terminal domain-containing protein n=1 Tax=Nocardiopsis dassonvillei TaxID=2014 RepID=UPI003F55BC25